MKKFARANQGTCSNQVAIVKPGQHIEKNQVLADGPAMDNGDLALGQNVTIAFMTWHGYNYEDAVIMSERLVKDDVYTTLHIEEYTIDRRTTKLGSEYFTAEVPSAQEEHKRFLDKRGIVVPGAEVKEGDILVGKTTPKAISEPTPEEKLLHSIFSDKAREGRDASLRVPHGGSGIVLDVKVFSRKMVMNSHQMSLKLLKFMSSKREKFLKVIRCLDVMVIRVLFPEFYLLKICHSYQMVLQ